MACLTALREVMGAEAWIAAGFIRNMIWDQIQGREAEPLDDVDVVYFDLEDQAEETEKDWDRRLARHLPGVPWSVKNQVRMARRNKEGPYRDVSDALAHYLETATAVAVQVSDAGQIEILAPYGCADLFAMVLRPTSSGLARIDQLQARLRAKGWRARWPDLKFVGFAPN